MQTLYKWDYETHSYKEFLIDDDWKCAIYAGINDIINCPHCGKELVVGKGYTSLEIHEQQFGFGYVVCESCYNKERERKRLYKNE